MNKPEYSDLYKFIVSLGLILIVFSVFLPWLFLRESFDALVSASEISNLTPSAQTLILYRQNVALWFVQNIIWISSLPAAAGLISLISGLVLWRRKQILVDQKDILETEKLRLEVKKMSPEQIVEKVMKEVFEEVQDEQIANELILVEPPGQVSAINKYFQTEKMVIDKLANCFGASNVRPNLKIGKTEIDILVRVSPKERAIFEIKSIRKSTNIAGRQRDVIDFLIKAVKSYNTVAISRNTYGVGLLILNDNDAENLHSESAKNVTAQLIDNIFIKIITITEQDFLNLENAELKSMLRKH